LEFAALDYLIAVVVKPITLAVLAVSASPRLHICGNSHAVTAIPNVIVHFFPFFLILPLK
jgi:hypothetical protein